MNRTLINNTAKYSQNDQAPGLTCLLIPMIVFSYQPKTLTAKLLLKS